MVNVFLLIFLTLFFAIPFQSAFFGFGLGDGALCLTGNDLCDNHCCPRFLFGVTGVCGTCCYHGDCSGTFPQPPAGEFGTPFCGKDHTCVSHPNDNKIPDTGYPVWLPSETIDNSKVFRRLDMERHVVPGTDPVFTQVWYFDLSEQEEGGLSLADVEVTRNSIKIPLWARMHGAYSKTYPTFGESETGIVTTVMGDNEASLVTNYPKTTFVEKYHTLTFDGQKDTSRADFFVRKAEEQLAEEPEFDYGKFVTRGTAAFTAVGVRGTITSQVEAGIDQAVVWQARRFANDFPRSAIGSLNPSSVPAWADHEKKCKKAIELAKDPSFEREYLKSEQHCKHFEEGNGVDYTDTHAIMPLGRPIVTSSGEMVNAPVHYLGFVGGVIIADYDEETSVLQIYFQGHSVSRQYADVAFPGPEGLKGSALYVSAVTDGPDYVVSDKDGRTNEYLRLEQPDDDRSQFLGGRGKDYTLWARPKSETCKPGIEDGDFWTEMDLEPGAESIFDVLTGTLTLSRGVVQGMPCADVWMRSDAGAGTHGFDQNEMGVWGHFLMEVTDETTRTLGLARWWDNWECFYQDKDMGICEAERPGL